MMWKVAAFYKFTALENLSDWQAKIKAECAKYGVCGTILLAPEGINSTCAAKPEDLDAFITWLGTHKEFDGWELKFSAASEQPFKRMKVRLKKEIVTIRNEMADPTKIVGTYVSPAEWNKIIADPETILIDTRNDYEVEIGTFKNAIDPKTDSFHEFPRWVKEHLDPAKHKKVAMFCTGGIRCEKASSYMKAEGFEEVYHLKGGILQYLEDVPAEQSLWDGECFVFDERVAVGHGLKEGNYTMCYGCGAFITKETLEHKDYEPGIHCPKCKGTHSEEKLRSMRDQHKHYAKIKKSA
ncbi:MAG: hypothetical protein CMH30_00610 [Micavibrio sp.]|nr:hypothetical protein [Micavibrio sp.]